MTRPTQAYIAEPRPGSPRTVACPNCGVGRGHACRKTYGTVNRGEITPNHHPERKRAAREAADSD